MMRLQNLLLLGSLYFLLPSWITEIVEVENNVTVPIEDSINSGIANINVTKTGARGVVNGDIKDYKKCLFH